VTGVGVLAEYKGLVGRVRQGRIPSSVSADVAEEGTERGWEGLPHLYILTTTPTQARIDTMKQIIMDNTEQRGGTPFFFHPMPVLSYRYPQMKSPPVPNLFASPLERAGHPAMRLDEMGSA
jgi:hypothetical protein